MNQLVAIDRGAAPSRAEGDSGRKSGPVSLRGLCQKVVGSALVVAGMASALAVPARAADESYSPPPAPRPLVLLDYYHRTKKATWIGRHLLTGSYSDTVGRYQTDDFSHTNSYDSFVNALERNYDLRVHETPLVKDGLRGADIVVLINPEKPTEKAPVPVLTDEEIASLRTFAEEGGTVVALLNSVGAKGTEDFEIAQMRKLVRAFGVDWNDTNTEYSDIPMSRRQGYFYNIPLFHYGAGCTLRILDSAVNPQVLLEVKEDNGVSPPVRGPGIVLTRAGKGKFLCIGDTGSWGGGNMSRPWAENRRFLEQLFAYALRSRDIAPPQIPAGKSLRYAVQVGKLNVVPTGNPLSAVKQPGMERYVPRPRTAIPYFEGEGVIELKSLEAGESGARRYTLSLGEFTFFQNPAPRSKDETVAIETNRQGAVIELVAEGDLSRRLAPDLPALFALIPNDAVRVGDRWSKLQDLRVNPVRGNDLGITKPMQTEVIYVRDETFEGQPCRLFRAQAEVWLPDVGVRIDDLLPKDSAEWGGAKFELMAGRGGRILFKQQQWIAADTGIVLKAETQTRLLAWLHRVGETLPVKMAQKDDLMMVSLASTASFTLQK